MTVLQQLGRARGSTAVDQGAYPVGDRLPLLTKLIAVMLAISSATTGLRRGFPLPGLRLSEVLALVALVLTFWGISSLRVGWCWTRLDGAFFVYAILSLLLPILNTAVLRGAPLSSDALRLGAAPVLLLCLYFAARFTVSSGGATLLIVGVLVCSDIIAALAILQSFGPKMVQQVLVQLTGTDIFDTPGWVPVPRATSLFAISHNLGAYLLLPLFVAWCGVLLSSSRTRILWRVSLALSFAFLLLALGLTVTFAPIIGGLVGLMLLALLLRRQRALLGLFGSLSVVGLLLSGVLAARIASQSEGIRGPGPSWLPQTVSYRIGIWQDQFIPFLRHYLALGWGNEYPASVEWTHTENQYLTWLMRGGVPLVTVGLGLLIVVLN